MVPLLPSITAGLNTVASVLLIFGFLAIRRAKFYLHVRLMSAALVVSAAFLAVYVYHHYTASAVVRYEGSGPMQVVYYLVLGSHIPLAAGMLPFIIRVFYLARCKRYEDHKDLAKKVFPVWLYVSITGVVIYLMLYLF